MHWFVIEMPNPVTGPKSMAQPLSLHAMLPIFWLPITGAAQVSPPPPPPPSAGKIILCHELVCIMVIWTWYNGRDIFFHITSGRISMWKGVNQLKELFFLNLIIFLNIYLKLANQRYLMIKKTLFFTIHNKNGALLSNFKPKWPYPDSDQSTWNPLFTMTTSQCACKPVMTTQAFSRRNQHRAKALCLKSGGCKKVLVVLRYHSIQHMLSI